MMVLLIPYNDIDNAIHSRRASDSPCSTTSKLYAYHLKCRYLNAVFLHNPVPKVPLFSKTTAAVIRLVRDRHMVTHMCAKQAASVCSGMLTVNQLDNQIVH